MNNLYEVSGSEKRELDERSKLLENMANEYKFRLYEMCHNPHVLVEIESKSKIVEPFSMQESKLSKYKAKVTGLLENVNKVLKGMKIEMTNEPSIIQDSDSNIGKKSVEREHSSVMPSTKLPSIKSLMNIMTSPSQENNGNKEKASLGRK